MILTDFLTCEHDLCWDIARQCGVEHAVIRLPENGNFDVENEVHWRQIYDSFTNFGIRPIILEPMPNFLHDHIKMGDEKRDECIEKVIHMFPIMDKLGIRTICFNFMAHIGWLRTASNISERGGALVTGFDIDQFVPSEKKITEKQLWDNYEYFIRAVIPYAEKYDIHLALHPDDPPVEKLGNVSRIMINAKNIDRAVNIVKSPNLGITMCQATYAMMGEDLYQVISYFADKIKFVHFRNAVGNKYHFRETFHDNGSIEMGKILNLYRKCKVDVPIRVDHVPTMVGEKKEKPGYDALGRLYAIGYLKGLLEGIEENDV